jgi:hypothetical protein
MQTDLLTSDNYLKKTVPVGYTKLIKASSALQSSYRPVSKKREREREICSNKKKNSK